MIDEGGWAFPRDAVFQFSGTPDERMLECSEFGMSLRMWLVGMTLKTMSIPVMGEDYDEIEKVGFVRTYEACVHTAFMLADMVIERMRKDAKE